MSLPPELRVLCYQISSTSTVDLPYVTPMLLQNVLRCGGVLSSAPASVPKAHESETSVLVHKLKTQVSTLLYGKSAEGRFAAVVLVKGIVDVGGWEILRGAESWLRGLLQVLGKQDPTATKRLCILAITDIYIMSQHYQSLVREMTTPTLPTFVSSCLNMTSGKSSGKSSATLEVIFDSFSALIPHHPTIFRPSVNQIRFAIRPHIVPTILDSIFVSKSLRGSARRLAVHLYQTAAKNGSGEEWGKAVRELVDEIHSTSDQVFRAVIEDWESSCGRISQNVDMDLEIHGGGKSERDFPPWTGISAGLERLTGLIEFLGEHFKYQTTTAVTIPLGSVVDLLSRLMSIVPPTLSSDGRSEGGVRLHPAVERNEREGLWAGLPQVFAAAIKIYIIIAERMRETFTSLAQTCLESVAWTFSAGQKDALYRGIAYRIFGKILALSGLSLPRLTVEKISIVAMACCNELKQAHLNTSTWVENYGKNSSNEAASNEHHLMQIKAAQSTSSNSEVLAEAHMLLPLLLSHLPQEHLPRHLRTELDRTAIIIGSKDAMLASVMNHYPGRSGVGPPSILPHLCRAYPSDTNVQAFLRPRMPTISLQALLNVPLQDPLEYNQERENDDAMEDFQAQVIPQGEDVNAPLENVDAHEKMLDFVKPAYKRDGPLEQNIWGQTGSFKMGPTVGEPGLEENTSFVESKETKIVSTVPSRQTSFSAPVLHEESDGSESSAHLVMVLSDSEDEV